MWSRKPERFQEHKQSDQSSMNRLTAANNYRTHKRQQGPLLCSCVTPGVPHLQRKRVWFLIWVGENLQWMMLKQSPRLKRHQQEHRNPCRNTHIQQNQMINHSINWLKDG